MSTSQILRVESGEFDIMLSTLLKLCRELGVPPGLVLEQGALPNPGFYAKLLGEQGIPGILRDIPTDERPRYPRGRVIMLCAQAATTLAALLQSSNATKLVTSVAFPLETMSEAFKSFADKIDKLAPEDRLSIQSELDSDSYGLLSRLELVTPAMAVEFLRNFKGHADLRPDLLKLI